MSGLESFTDALHWVQGTALAEAIRSGTWTYAVLEALHLIGLGLLFGAIVTFDLRLMGLSSSLAAGTMARHNLPIAAGGFALAALTGLLMFTADAVALSANRAFQVKLGVIALAGLNALAFHFGPMRSIDKWEQKDGRPPRIAVMAGFSSLVLWIVVIVCGRLIAYM